MDGDDDLFAVFDADENAEDKPSQPTSERQVMVLFLSQYYSAIILISDGRGKFSGWDLWNEETTLSEGWGGGEGGEGDEEEAEEGGGAAGDDHTNTIYNWRQIHNVIEDKWNLQLDTNTICNQRRIQFAIGDKYNLQLETNTICNWKQIHIAIGDKYILQLETNT